MTGERTDAIAVDPPVERLLATAATDATWPATPDLRSTVLERIEAPGAPDLRPSVLTRIAGRAVGSPRRARVLRPLALAVLLVIAIAGLAAGLGYGLPGLDIRRVDETPAPPGAPLGLGSPAPLADVLALDEPRILLPGALPPPDAAFERGVGDRRIVTVAWRASPGDPVLEDTDLVLTLMAVPGTTAEPLISKAAGPQTRVEPIDVDGDRGWWITGAPHEIMVLRSDGEVGVLRAAVVGDTLVFAREGTLYRLESALGKAATLEIARSLKRP
ncbi:MAG TPA: hypothetical protein VKB30_05755 [Candidatus Limnocylindrales bacterium]|nr:hypothetical protein [Candidatus Limnocylindrales bacterium]